MSGFKVITLTDRAADRLKAIMADAEKPIAGLRVGVKNGGCAGMSYTMEYAEERKAGEAGETRGPHQLGSPCVARGEVVGRSARIAGACSLARSSIRSRAEMRAPS